MDRRSSRPFVLLLVFGSFFCTLTAADSITSSKPENSKPKEPAASPSPSPFEKIEPDRAAVLVCGCYHLPGSVLSGHSLSVFPDGTAIVASFSDISPPDLVAAGTWSILNGVLKIAWQEWRRPPTSELRQYRKEIVSGEFVLYLRRDESHKALLWFLLVPAGKEPTFEERFDYPLKTADYVDWAKIRDSLKSAK